MCTSILVTVMLPALLLSAPQGGADEPRAESTQETGFKPPPGFSVRKRGEHVVYCRREEPRGTRFPSEVCDDEQGIREMPQSQREDQSKLDQTRKTQATTNHC